MKTKIKLNIGLESMTLGKVNFILVINALTGAGFILQDWHVMPSSCEDGAEDCLVWEGLAPQDWPIQLHGIAVRFGQSCIAWKASGFSGEKPYAEFNDEDWKD